MYAAYPTTVAGHRSLPRRHRSWYLRPSPYVHQNRGANWARGRATDDPHHRLLQPEGRHRQDHQHPQRRRRPGRAGPPRARARPRPPGQPDDGDRGRRRRARHSPSTTCSSTRTCRSPRSSSARPCRASTSSPPTRISPPPSWNCSTSSSASASSTTACGRPTSRAYDYVLIDSPPALNILSINILVATGELVIPIEPHPLSLMVLRRLFETVARSPPPQPRLAGPRFPADQGPPLLPAGRRHAGRRWTRSSRTCRSCPPSPSRSRAPNRPPSAPACSSTCPAPRSPPPTARSAPGSKPQGRNRADGAPRQALIDPGVTTTEAAAHV